MQKSHLEAIRRYDSLRDEARTIAWGVLPRHLKERLSLSGISIKELNAFKTWQDHEDRKVSWDWQFANRYKDVHPKAFDLSVWHGNNLQSLSLGRPTCHGNSIRLDFIERVPGFSVFAGELFAISQVAFETYGRLIGADFIRVMEPINAKLIKYYTSKDVGFDLVKASKGNPHYMVKKL